MKVPSITFLFFLLLLSLSFFFFLTSFYFSLSIFFPSHFPLFKKKFGVIPYVNQTSRLSSCFVSRKDEYLSCYLFYPYRFDTRGKNFFKNVSLDIVHRNDLEWVFLTRKNRSNIFLIVSYIINIKSFARVSPLVILEKEIANIRINKYECWIRLTKG